MSALRALRVFLADDHIVLRQGLKAILEREGLDVVGEASDGHLAVKTCETLQPDIAILDVAMPLLNGIDAARELAGVCPSTRIVLLTMYPEECYVLAALRAGVAGYVLKSNAASNLIEAIQAVSRGETYLSPGVSRTVIQAFLSRTEAPADPLSTRERHVLQLIAEGKNMKEIGDVLTISARTAESHRARIMRKLDIHDIPGLVRHALKLGLIGWEMEHKAAAGVKSTLAAPADPPSRLLDVSNAVAMQAKVPLAANGGSLPHDTATGH
jgi:DNA-binding NarL/FixJ family response regulator